MANSSAFNKFVVPWSFEYESEKDFVFLVCNGERVIDPKTLGSDPKLLENITEVREGNKNGTIKVSFADSDATRSLSLTGFEGSANDLCKRLYDSRENRLDFMTKLTDEVSSVTLKQDSAQKGMKRKRVDDGQSELEISPSGLATPIEPKTTPALGTRSPRVTPLRANPTSRIKSSERTPLRSRLQNPFVSGINTDDTRLTEHSGAGPSSDDSSFSVFEKHLGRFTVDVRNLMHPPDEYLCRPMDENWIEELVGSLDGTPTITTIPVMIDPNIAKKKEDVDTAKLHDYPKWTLGGNHVTEALKRLTKAQARHVGNFHNSQMKHKPLTLLQEVSQMRRIIYEVMLLEKEMDTIAKLPAHVKEQCMFQMAHEKNESKTSVADDKFLIASFPPLVWDAAEAAMTRSSETLTSRHFRVFRDISDVDKVDILNEVARNEISMKMAAQRIVEAKQVALMKQVFIKNTRSESWEEACRKFPTFTESSVLRSFLNGGFNLKKKRVPDAFIQHCFDAINHAKPFTDPKRLHITLQIQANETVDITTVDEGRKFIEGTINKIRKNLSGLGWFQRLVAEQSTPQSSGTDQSVSTD